MIKRPDDLDYNEYIPPLVQALMLLDELRRIVNETPEAIVYSIFLDLNYDHDANEINILLYEHEALRSRILDLITTESPCHVNMIWKEKADSPRYYESKDSFEVVITSSAGHMNPNKWREITEERYLKCKEFLDKKETN